MRGESQEAKESARADSGRWWFGVGKVPWVLAAILGVIIYLVNYPLVNRTGSIGHAAHREVMNLVDAIKQYELEYSKFPLSEGEGLDFVNLTTDAATMRVLLGNDEVLNPRGSRYYEGKAAKGGKNGLDYGDGSEDPDLLDPWGRPYHILIDSNNDGDVTTPDGIEIQMSVIAYSLGTEGVLGVRSPKSW